MLDTITQLVNSVHLTRLLSCKDKVRLGADPDVLVTEKSSTSDLIDCGYPCGIFRFFGLHQPTNSRLWLHEADERIIGLTPAKRSTGGTD